MCKLITNQAPNIKKIRWAHYVGKRCYVYTYICIPSEPSKFTLPCGYFSHFSNFLLVHCLVGTFLFFLFSFYRTHKKRKNTNKRISYFFPLTYLLGAFFIFVHLFAFRAFAWLRFCALVLLVLFVLLVLLVLLARANSFC